MGVTVRQALKREWDNGRGGRNSERCSYRNRNGIEKEVERGDHKGSDSFDWTAFIIISLPAWRQTGEMFSMLSCRFTESSLRRILVLIIISTKLL